MKSNQNQRVVSFFCRCDFLFAWSLGKCKTKNERDQSKKHIYMYVLKWMQLCIWYFVFIIGIVNYFFKIEI